jgi:predicted MPP superfamily phosphohydrolase
MVLRFWLATLAFHLPVAALCVFLGRRWGRGESTPPPAGRWWGRLFGDAALLSLAVLACGALAARLLPDPGFAFLRFVCQALFGEAVLLGLWLSVLHWRRRQGRRATLLAAGTLALVAVYWRAYHVEPRDLRVTRHALDLSSGQAGAGRLRILHLSDLQTPRVGEHEERALRAVLAQQPDLIVLTGDYIHERLAPTRPRAQADLRALIRRLPLQAPLGVFAVQGDADRDWPALFDRTGVTCLQDSAAAIPLPDGQVLALVGLSRARSRSRSPEVLAQVLEEAGRADLVMVAGHAPDFVASLPHGAGVDLVLAGHTHGGQVVLPFFGPPMTLSRLPRRFAADLHEYRGVPLHVTRGVGLERGSAPQIRFLCPPEVCVLDVRYRRRTRIAAR